jgi:hypothetical protein
MPKNIEDIIVPDRGLPPSRNNRSKSIRDIPIPEGRRKRVSDISFPDRRKSTSHIDVEPVHIHKEEPALDEMENHDIPEHVAYKPEPRMPRFGSGIGGGNHAAPRRASRNKMPGKKALVAGVIAIVVLALAVMSLFSGATLAYTPKSQDLTFNNDLYSASKTGEGSLLFSVVKLSLDKGLQVSATGEEQVSEKASGTIIVYNKTNSSQKLIATTRFETADGKVYRIKDAISIPAAKTVGGKTEPGSIEAVVTADQPGESYNIGLSDFTVPGLKGDPRFETIYARSKTPMTGGFVGVRKQVSGENLDNAKKELQETLNNELIEQAKAQVPADFILFSNLASYTYDDLPQSDPTANGIPVNMRGNFYGVMFKRSDLANYLANSKGAITPADSVEIPELDSLNLAFVGDAPADLLEVEKINFTVNGEAMVMWRTDEESLKSDLRGRDKGEIQSILANYPSVINAEATIRPFWTSSFPDKSSDITIKRKAVK